MPIFFQQDIDEHTRLAVWKIEEAETFFLQEVPLQRTITHPHKRLQHLAGRYLLKYLFPDFPVALIQVADTRKPFLEDEAFHFSISHCGDFAAVIVSSRRRVGIDIELATGKVQRIMPKFLGDAEKKLVKDWRGSETELATVAWSGKEAVFKWYGLGGVDFKEHMQIEKIEEKAQHVFDMEISFRKAEPLRLHLKVRLFDGLCLSFVTTV